MSKRELPEDVQVEILSGLPVKSLVRFRCVCKSWYTLTSNPDFIAKHLTSHNPHRGTILHRHDWDGLGQPRVSMLSDETLELSGDVDPLQLFQNKVAGGVRVFGPCNGILCFSGILCKDREVQFDYEQIVLWNPATRESKMLPPIQRQPDLPLSVSNVGLGFDPNTNDYKVVRVQNFDSRSEVAVYSLSADSWGVIHSSANPSYKFRLSRFPSYLNGVHHWWAAEKNDISHPFLLSFDMSNEVFQEVLPPPTEESFFQEIAVTHNCVALLLQCGNVFEKSLDIWTLSEFCGERCWIKIVTIEHILPLLWDLTQLRDDGLIVLSNQDGGLELYDPRTQQLRDLGIGRESGDGFCQLVSYTESLVFLSGSRNVIEQQDNP